MRFLPSFLDEHRTVTRRYLMQAGAGSLVAGGFALRARRGYTDDKPAADGQPEPAGGPPPEKTPELGDGIKRSKSFVTPQDLFYDVSRGDPLPHGLPEEKKREVGLTRETWKMEVVSDPDNPVQMRSPFTAENNKAFDFAQLMQLADKHAVRFAKVMTCLNLGCPLGLGIWEGVPLREVIWLTQPRDTLRRVYYYGYHNDQPDQMFRSSLPIGRVLEDYFGLPPVILCYKLNGQWLTPQRGGPVRVVVPEHYGYKSVKWITHVVLTSLFHANDTYAEQGNDIDSPLKTFAATIDVPADIKAGQEIPITGYAQVGIAGLSKVQAWIQPADDGSFNDAGNRFAKAPWIDMEILPPPTDWGGELAEGKIPLPTLGFDDATGQPKQWPMPLAMVHWAGVLEGVPAGKYTLRCRAIDSNDRAQPDPRPFRKSGHAVIEQVAVTVS